MAERLFMAYWSEGQDVSDRDVLAKCAGETGINAAQIRELLDSAQDVEETKAEIQHATKHRRDRGSDLHPRAELCAGRRAVAGGAGGCDRRVAKEVTAES
jgi:hypothetical protein